MKRFPLILLLAAGVLFAGTMAHLFHLRFASGDIYPRYSSLRADPLGVKGLYDSLDQLIVTRRNYAPLARVEQRDDTVFFYLGMPPRSFYTRAAELKDLEGFVIRGGRLVVAFAPVRSRSDNGDSAPAVTDPETLDGDDEIPESEPAPPPGRPEAGEEGEQGDGSSEKEPRSRPRTVPERWGFALRHAALDEVDDAYVPATARLMSEDELPSEILCRSSLYFKITKPLWRVIYDRVDGKPVLIERGFGDGTIVLLADTFLLSNEALMQERESALLAWLTGPARRAIFDETHLGVAENPGVATLIRKYRLHGFIAALLLLALLFVWKNSLSFMPPHEDSAAERGGLLQGRDSAAGIVNLLHRNIRTTELLDVCFKEWAQTCSRGKAPAKLEQIRTLVEDDNQRPPKERRPVRTYQAIARLLAHRQGTNNS